MAVPYDRWGRMLEGWDNPIYDEDGTLIGNISDDYRYVQDNDVRTVSKKQALDYALEWYSRLDGGWINGEDEKIYFAYDDGTFRDVDDNPKKAVKRQGLIGISVSTADYEVAWGGEINKRTGQFTPWTVTTFYDDGTEREASNTYSGYKTVGQWIERTRTPYNNPNGRGGYMTKREVIRKSTVRPVNSKL